MDAGIFNGVSGRRKRIIIFAIAILILAVLFRFIFPEKFSRLADFLTGKKVNLENLQPKVVEENIVPPQPRKILSTTGRMISAGPVETPIIPKNSGEEVIIPQAILTAKGVYNAALPEAQKWSSSAKLVFIKSIGALALNGKSDGWQIVFGSKMKKGKGYEMIFGGDKIISQKEIDSVATGADLPSAWRDSDAALMILRQTPNFSGATVSSINFFYNIDAKIWQYAFATSKGTTTIE